jgi:hypothetical protein
MLTGVQGNTNGLDLFPYELSEVPKLIVVGACTNRFGGHVLICEFRLQGPTQVLSQKSDSGLR